LSFSNTGLVQTSTITVDGNGSNINTITDPLNEKWYQYTPENTIYLSMEFT